MNWVRCLRFRAGPAPPESVAVLHPSAGFPIGELCNKVDANATPTDIGATSDELPNFVAVSADGSVPCFGREKGHAIGRGGSADWKKRMGRDEIRWDATG